MKKRQPCLEDFCLQKFITLIKPFKKMLSKHSLLLPGSCSYCNPGRGFRDPDLRLIRHSETNTRIQNTRRQVEHSPLQPNQIKLAVFFLYPVKSDAIILYCTVAYTGQVTFYKVPEKHNHVYLVTFLIIINTRS